MTEDTTTTTTTPPTTPPNTAEEAATEACSREELTELVRAIKFAKPDASQRLVHREIVEQLSEKEGFAFLKDIKLTDVKRVWKKAQQQQRAPSTAAASINTTNGNDGVMKLYTVGDGSVGMLAQEYSQAAAAALVAKETQEQEALHKNYVHLFLDVPLDRSGSRPHQALINFHDNNNKKNGKKGNKGGKADENDRGEIVKIQVAATNEGEVHPMLLYNENRSHKTFIHPDPNDDGYERIHNWIRDEGIAGALGIAGGSKAYFYGRLTKRKNIISVDVSSLAPPQSW